MSHMPMPISPLIVASGLCLTLSACAGSVGERAGFGGGGQGYEYGAAQEEVDRIVSDLEPVTLTYQPAASSERSYLGRAAIEWRDAVEEMSDGRITIDIVWGRAIADYDSVDDALADRRLDLSFTVPGYDPTEYPVYNDISNATSGFPTSPVLGNVATNAALADLGAHTGAVRSEFTEKGLVPLIPLSGTSQLYTFCTTPIDERGDWAGRQLRAGGQSQHRTFAELGASAVFMESGEIYEALQRKAIDCESGRITSAVEAGVFDVAPHIGYAPTSGGIANMVSGAIVAGSSFNDLPLAYQQIIFDTLPVHLAETFRASAQATVDAVAQAEDKGGEVTPFDDRSLAAMDDASRSLRAEVHRHGRLGDDSIARIDDSVAEWTRSIEGLGYQDDSDLSEFAEAFEPDAVDWTESADLIFDRVLIDNRPS